MQTFKYLAISVGIALAVLVAVGFVYVLADIRSFMALPIFIAVGAGAGAFNSLRKHGRLKLW